MTLRQRERTAAEREALERVRGRIISGIHAGHLDPGDRLPSYRQLADETGVDLRAVGRIYIALQQEGLVEVRGRTGAYVAAQERIGGRVLAETARWAMIVLRESWSRRIPVPELPEFLHRCISTVTLRCMCIDSTEDQLASLCTELHRDFGLDTAPLHFDRVAAISADPATHEIPDELRKADLLATSTFHAAVMRRIATRLDVPLIVIRLDADFTRAIERHIEHSELAVICVDPRFAERVRVVFGGEHPQRIRPVLISDREAIARLEPARPILVSRLARQKLSGVTLPPELLPVNAPIIAPDSAAELIEVILRLNLEAMRHRSAD